MAKTTVDGVGKRDKKPAPSQSFWQLFTPDVGVVVDDALVLRPGRYLIGRDIEESDGVLLSDPRASRLHATVHVVSRGQRVRIADEDSRHGTFVNGQPVDEAWLHDGDVVRVGDSYFLLRLLPPKPEDGGVGALLGVSPAMRTLRHGIAQVAPHEVTVMVIGESGTGKELVAQAIHQLSDRPGPFIAINCSAIVEQLAESQLFGHVRGAFSGADNDHDGYFRAADGGTLFLDEIGDLPLQLQPKLLRALEQHAVTPVGATSAAPFDVRVVVATHRNLEAMVRDESFRGDLYSRLAEFRLDVPPLRARREDVLPLLDHALDGVDYTLDPDLVGALLAYDWPFNVRELFAVASELRVRMTPDGMLTHDMVAHRLASTTKPSVAELPSASNDGADTNTPLEAPSREQFERIVAEHKGNVRAIARATARSRMQVYRWVEQFELDLAEYRDR